MILNHTQEKRKVKKIIVLITLNITSITNSLQYMSFS
jgi:hypothetical protein